MLFSIVIPVYNVERYLEACVNDILAQTCGDFEVILVDDGSTDGSPALCDALAARDGRVRAVHKPNGGSNSARNLGAEQAKGEYVCLVDGDDGVAPDWLEVVRRQIESAPRRPDIVLYCHRKDCDGARTDVIFDLPAGYYDRARLEEAVFPRLINKSPAHFYESLFSQAPWNKAFRRELLLAHLCRDEAIKVANDCAFTYECVLYARDMAVCHDVLYHYRADSAGSLQRSYHPDIYANYAALFGYMRRRLSPLHPGIPRQLNAFNYFHIWKSMCQDLAHFPTIGAAADHMRQGLESTGLLDYVNPRWLPAGKRLRIHLLRLRLYWLCAAMQKAREALRRPEPTGGR